MVQGLRMRSRLLGGCVSGAVAMGLSKDKKGETKNGVWWDGRRVVGGA